MATFCCWHISVSSTFQNVMTLWHSCKISIFLHFLTFKKNYDKWYPCIYTACYVSSHLIILHSLLIPLKQIFLLHYRSLRWNSLWRICLKHQSHNKVSWWFFVRPTDKLSHINNYEFLPWFSWKTYPES